MNKIIKLLFLGFLITLVIYSCGEKIEVVYGCTNSKAENYDEKATIDNGSCEGIYGCTDSTAVNYDPEAIINCGCDYENVRRVFVEDYSGHHCGNCPRAAEALHDLECKYGNQIIPLTVHVGFFADVIYGPPFDTDHRTDAGNELDSYFGNSGAGLPNGMVNRKEYNGSSVVAYPEWDTKVEEYLEFPAQAEVLISTSYNSGSRDLDIDVDVEVLSDLDAANYNLTVYLVEDSVIAAQLDYEAEPTEIEDYHHMHMLRGDVNGTWGENVTSSAVSTGTTYNRSYSINVDPGYNENNVYVIAFMHNNDTREVIQVNKSEYIAQ